MRSINIKKTVLTALFAALCFVGTYFFKIEIPTPIDRMMFHFGDVFCLMAAAFLGPVGGGLAGAIGMGIFDLVSGWADSFIFTFAFKFVQGIIAGLLLKKCFKKYNYFTYPISFITATIFYMVLYLSKSFVEKFYLLHFLLRTKKSFLYHHSHNKE